MATSMEGVRAGRPSRLDAFLPGGSADLTTTTTTSCSSPSSTARSGNIKRAHSTSVLEVPPGGAACTTAAAPGRRVIRHTRYIRAGSAEPPPPPALLGFICSAEAHRRASTSSPASAASRHRTRTLSASAGASAASSTESLNSYLMEASKRERNRRGSSQESSCSTASVRSVSGRSVKSSIAAAAAISAPLPRRGAKMTPDARAPWAGEGAQPADHAPHVAAPPKLPTIGGGTNRGSMRVTSRVSSGFLDRVAADIPAHLEELERQLGLRSSISSAGGDSTDGALDLDLYDVDLDDIDVSPTGSYENLLTEEELNHVTSAIAAASPPPKVTKVSAIPNLDARYERVLARELVAAKHSPKSMAQDPLFVKTAELPMEIEIKPEHITSVQSTPRSALTTTQTVPSDPGGGVALPMGDTRRVDTTPITMEETMATPGGRQEEAEGRVGVTGVETCGGRSESLEDRDEAGISTAGSEPSAAPPPPPPPSPTAARRGPTLPPLSEQQPLNTSSSSIHSTHHLRPPGLLETEINDALEVVETQINDEVVPEVAMWPGKHDDYVPQPYGTPTHQPEVVHHSPPGPTQETLDLPAVLPEAMLSAYEDYVRVVPSQSAKGERVGEGEGDIPTQGKYDGGHQADLSSIKTEIQAAPSDVSESKEQGELFPSKRVVGGVDPYTTTVSTSSTSIPPIPTTTPAELLPSTISPPVHAESALEKEVIPSSNRAQKQEEESNRSSSTMEETSHCIDPYLPLASPGTAVVTLGEVGAGSVPPSSGVVNTDIPTDITRTTPVDPSQQQQVKDTSEVMTPSSPEKQKKPLKGILKKTSSFEVKEPETKDSERKIIRDSESQPSQINETSEIGNGDEVKSSKIIEKRDSEIPSKFAESKFPEEKQAVFNTGKNTQNIQPEVHKEKEPVKEAQKDKPVANEETSGSIPSEFPRLSDVLSMSSFNPSALDVRMRLRLLDVAFNFLLLTPLTVLFYYATCRLMELCLLCLFPRLGAWVLLFIGAGIEFAASFWQRSIASRSPRPQPGCGPFADVNIPFLLTSKCFNFVLGIGNVFHMLAMTSLVDVYVGTDYDVSLRAALTSLVVLWTLKCGRNIVAPPLYVGIDADDLGVFTSSTMFKVQTDLSVESSADILGTVGVVMSFVHLHWAGVWNCADAALFPSHFTLSMLTSLLLGSSICLLFMLLQQSAMEISRNLEREKKEPLRLIFENVFITGANVGVILLWRGLWMVYDIMGAYFPIYCRTWDITPLATCVLSFLLLALAHCSSSVLFKGCEIDAELTNGSGVRFATGYFTEILDDPAERDGFKDQTVTSPKAVTTVKQVKSPNGRSATTSAKAVKSVPMKTTATMKPKNA